MDSRAAFYPCRSSGFHDRVLLEISQGLQDPILTGDAERRRWRAGRKVTREHFRRHDHRDRHHRSDHHLTTNRKESVRRFAPLLLPRTRY